MTSKENGTISRRNLLKGGIALGILSALRPLEVQADLSKARFLKNTTGEKRINHEDILEATSIEQTGELFLSPVEATKTINPESAWILAEPGRVLDNTATFVIPSVDLPHYANVPEGGFAYFSMGEGKIEVDGVTLDLAPAKGLNYLVLIRGRINDGIVDSDFNETAIVTDFKPGHATWSKLQPGAYVSADWFMQQVQASSQTINTNESYSNCGADGCSNTHVVLLDVDSHFYQEFKVSATDLSKWELINKNK